MTEVDPRIALAREYLQGARGRDPNHMPPSRLMSELAETRRQLGLALAAAADLEQAAAGYSLTAEQMGIAIAGLGDARLYRAGDDAAADYRQLEGELFAALQRRIGGHQ